ncbi:MAG: Fic family protein [Herminiimonas sp.]|nr:Fic family protein [Herminiimonas sp.]
MTQDLGYKWLSATYEIEPVHRFRVTSQVGTSRKTVTTDGFTVEIYTTQSIPHASLAGHLAFALKHEGCHLEFLARLFDRLDPHVLEQWIGAEPTGAYARRAGFFYEWLTGRSLCATDVVGGNYIDAIDADACFTATVSTNNQRWRVRDNLPGTRNYCPTVARLAKVRDAEEYDCAAALAKLEREYGNDILMRSAVWLTIKESRSSFAIEHEEKQLDRIKRFAAVMDERCGAEPNPLEADALRVLQSAILGPVATRYGVRRSPVLVGHTAAYTQVVDYIGPHWDQIDNLLEGLQEFESRTSGRSAIVRAAVISFGFVYIHPMADGNGRISRFLVNDVLRRDKAVPPPYILPISATITHSPRSRIGYDRVLEQFSQPLMRRYAHNYRFGPDRLEADGIRTNFEFDEYDDAIFAWRFPDMTAHVEYLLDIISVTISAEMQEQAAYLRNHLAARVAVKDLIEGPDPDIDRIIRSINENNWHVSNRLRTEFPLLQSVAGLEENLITAVREAFSPSSNNDTVFTAMPPPV